MELTSFSLITLLMEKVHLIISVVFRVPLGMSQSTSQILTLDIGHWKMTMVGIAWKKTFSIGCLVELLSWCDQNLGGESLLCLPMSGHPKDKEETSLQCGLGKKWLGEVERDWKSLGEDERKKYGGTERREEIREDRQLLKENWKKK